MCVYTYVRDVRALVCALIQTIITAHPIQTDREAKANMIKVQLYFRVAQICGNRIFFITIFCAHRHIAVVDIRILYGLLSACMLNLSFGRNSIPIPNIRWLTAKWIDWFFVDFCVNTRNWNVQWKPLQDKSKSDCRVVCTHIWLR